MKYFWRVYADIFNMGGRYNEGDWRAFQVMNVGDFYQELPGNGATVDAGPVTFKWQRPSNAENLRAQSAAGSRAGETPVGRPVKLLRLMRAATGPATAYMLRRPRRSAH